MGLEELLEHFDKDVFEHLVIEEQAAREGKKVDTSWQRVPRTFMIECYFDHDGDGDLEENKTQPHECTVPRVTLDILKLEVAEMFNVVLDTWVVNQREFRDGVQTAQRRETIVRTEFRKVLNKLYYHPPYYDSRIPNFCPRRYLIDEQLEWRIITADQPWTEERQREKAAEKMRHLLCGTEPSGILDAAHGFWELSVRKEHHEELCFEERVLHSIVYGVRCGHPEVMARCIACVWNLATTKRTRRRLVAAGLVEALYDAANLAMVDVVPLEVCVGGLAKYRWCSPDDSKVMKATEGLEEISDAALEAEADLLDDVVMTEVAASQPDAEAAGDQEDKAAAADGADDATGAKELDPDDPDYVPPPPPTPPPPIPQDEPGPETRVRANGKKNLLKSSDGSHYIGFVKDPSLMDDAIALSHMTQPLRDRLQLYILGVLGVLVVDKVARHHMVHKDPGQMTLAAYINYDFFPNDTKQELKIRSRRAAENLLALLHRDRTARREFALNSGIETVTKGLNSACSMLEHPDTHVKFVGSSIIALYAADPEGAELIAQSGVAAQLFNASVKQLELCVVLINQEQKRLPKILVNQEIAEAEEKNPSDIDRSFLPRMAETLAISVWGSSDGYLKELAGVGLSEELCKSIPRIAACTMRLKNVGKAAYAMGGALCVCARDPVTAANLLKASSYTNFLKGIGTRGCIKAMMTSSTAVKERTRYLTHPDDAWYIEEGSCASVSAMDRGSGRVRAEAAGVYGNFLAHNRDCGPNIEDGPFRELMSETRLRLTSAMHASALSPATSEKAFKQLHRATAACYMYIGTQLPRVWPALEIKCLVEMSEYSSKPTLFDQPLQGQFLAACFWLIMRNGQNRAFLVNLLVEETEAAAEEPKAEEQQKPVEVAEGEAGEADGQGGKTASGVTEEELGIADVEGKVQRFMILALDTMENYFPSLETLVPPAWTDDVVEAPALYMFTFFFGAIWLFVYEDEDARQLHEDVYRKEWGGWWTVPKVSLKPFQDEETLNRLLTLALRTLALPNQEIREPMKSVVIGLVWNMATFDVGIRDFLVQDEQYGVVPVLNEIIVNTSIKLVELRKRALSFVQYCIHHSQDGAVEVSREHVDEFHAALRKLYQDPSYDFVYAAVRGLIRLTKLSKERNISCIGDLVPTLKLINHADKRFGRVASPMEILELRHVCLLLILNLSTVPENQVELARKSIYLVLSVNRSPRSPQQLRQVTSCILHNISKHPRNRTRFYKLELQYKKRAVERASENPSKSVAPSAWRGAGGWDGKHAKSAAMRMAEILNDATGYIKPAASLDFPPTPNVYAHDRAVRRMQEQSEEGLGATSPMFDDADDADDADDEFAEMDPFEPTEKFMAWAESTFGESDGGSTSRGGGMPSSRGGGMPSSRGGGMPSSRGGGMPSSRRGGMPSSRGRRMRPVTPARHSSQTPDGMHTPAPPPMSVRDGPTPRQRLVMELPGTVARGGRAVSRIGDVSERATSRMSMASQRSTYRVVQEKTYLEQLMEVEEGERLEEEANRGFGAFGDLMLKPMHRVWVPLPRLPGTGPLVGKERWQPRIIKYIMKGDHQEYPGTARRLMMGSQPTKTFRELRQDALLVAKEVAHDRLPMIGGVNKRPPTAMMEPPVRLEERENVPVTMLLPSKDGWLVMDAEEEDAADAAGAAGAAGLDEPASALAPDGHESKREDSEEDEEEASDYPLNVQLDTPNPANVVNFMPRSFDADHPARLTIFEAIPGARVYDHLFPKYSLPNGLKTYYYDRGNKYVDGVNFGDDAPPPRPVNLSDLYLNGLPYADVLEELCKMDPSFFTNTYLPDPVLGPIPRRHTLDVKDEPQYFGDMKITTMKIEMELVEQYKYEEEVRAETFGPRPDWDIRKSIFAPRERECDSRDFWDTPKTEARMLDLDMTRLLESGRFKGFLKREGEKVGKDFDTVIAEILESFKSVWDDLYGCFMWYSLQGSGDPYCMQLNSFAQFTDDCKIPDQESEKCKRSDLDTLFIVANFEEDKASELSKFNDDNSLMRFEFMEILIRMGVAKYGLGQLTEDPAEAFQELLDRNVFMYLGSEAIVKANDFRSKRLYNEETDHFLRTKKAVLQAMYSRYRLKPLSGGRRYKALRIDGWLKLIEDCDLLTINVFFTINQAKYAFMFGRMIVVDELKDENRWRQLTFVDFLDALGRVADAFCFPFPADLKRMGWDNMYEYMEYASFTPEDDPAQRVFKTRPSVNFSEPKTRPLKGKIEALLDLMFRRLDMEKDFPDYEYSEGQLLKKLKKIDKDIGP